MNTILGQEGKNGNVITKIQVLLGVNDFIFSRTNTHINKHKVHRDNQTAALYIPVMFLSKTL